MVGFLPLMRTLEAMLSSTVTLKTEEEEEEEEEENKVYNLSILTPA